MEQERFSNREIQLMFDKITDKLDQIRDDIRETNSSFDKRISALETDVGTLKTFQTRILTVWAVAVTLIGYAINKFL